MRATLLGTARGRFCVALLGLFVFVALFGALLAPYDPEASSTDELAAPSTWCCRRPRSR